MLTKNRKVEIINKFGKNDSDTGSTEVQVALLTERINSLTEHLRNLSLIHIAEPTRPLSVSYAV